VYDKFVRGMVAMPDGFVPLTSAATLLLVSTDATWVQMQARLHV
jgi:hypothetical protein